MTKLDLVLERLKALPGDQQDAIAEEIDHLLSDQSTPSLLTPAQRAELDRRLADASPDYVSHEDVVAEFEKNSAGEPQPL